MLSTQKFVNQNSSDEGFICDNAGLGRIPYLNIFQDKSNLMFNVKI